MNKNIMSACRFLLALVLVLTLHPRQTSAVCSLSCDGECREATHEVYNVCADVILNAGECCSNNSGKLLPCCNVKQDIPEDGRFFLLTTFRVSSSDFFTTGLTAFEDQGVINQTGFQPGEHLVLNLPRSTPIYLQNLSLLC